MLCCQKSFQTLYCELSEVYPHKYIENRIKMSCAECSQPILAHKKDDTCILEPLNERACRRILIRGKSGLDKHQAALLCNPIYIEKLFRLLDFGGNGYNNAVYLHRIYVTLYQYEPDKIIEWMNKFNTFYHPNILIVLIKNQIL